MKYLNRRYNRKIISDVSKSDIIYLFKNEYSRYFKKSRAIVVGSNHCDFHNSKKPETVLTTKGLENLIYKGISVYHIFPGKHELKEFFGDNRAFVLPPGVDTNIYYPNLSREAKLKVLFVGRLEKSKGVLEFLKVYNLVREQKMFEFHVAGTGSLSDKVMEHSSSDFIYHGALEEEDLAQLYRSCDVFLFPTQLDSFPVVILEALASGLYVLTTHEMRGTFDDFERLNYLSYVIPEPMELARVLLELLHSNLIGQLNKKAMFNKVRESYDWSYISAEFFGSLAKMIRT